jgi:phosphoserine phosphatase
MDGTLLETDVLAEGMKALARRPLAFASVLGALLLGGRPPFKRKIATLAALDIERLPVRSAFVDWLRDERSSGRTLWLATAADRITAEKVAARLGIFDGVIASDGATNLKAHAKRRALMALFPAGFVYAGDSAADLHVWTAAAAIVLVNARPGVVARAIRLGPPIERVFD